MGIFVFFPNLEIKSDIDQIFNQLNTTTHMMSQKEKKNLDNLSKMMDRELRIVKQKQTKNIPNLVGVKIRSQTMNLICK